jgi:hypothetical protein
MNRIDRQVVDIQDQIIHLLRSRPESPLSLTWIHILLQKSWPEIKRGTIAEGLFKLRKQNLVEQVHVSGYPIKWKLLET